MAGDAVRGNGGDDPPWSDVFDIEQFDQPGDVGGGLAGVRVTHVMERGDDVVLVLVDRGNARVWGTPIENDRGYRVYPAVPSRFVFVIACYQRGNLEF